MKVIKRKVGFDTKKYILAQAKSILKRVKNFDRKLYLEFGGKLFYDYHAARVLPGYDPNAKIKILQKLGHDLEFIFCVSAKDIQKGRIVGNFGINYGDFTLKTIDDLRENKLEINIVVINLYERESKAKQLADYLKRKGIKVYFQGVIKDYPNNLNLIASEQGYGKKPFIKTKRPIVIVTGAGPGSGKMATCLAMVYQDKLLGRDSGYAKFETFPIWDLPLNHPINIAYEAAAADIKDYNLVDPWHKKAYGKTAINYNRDVENYIIIQKILQRIISPDNFMNQYQSPTDMGVNVASQGIIDDRVCRQAARQELIRRYYRYHQEYLRGLEKKETVEIVEKLMKKSRVRLTDRKTVSAAQKAMKEAKKSNKGHLGIYCGSAIELPDGKIVTGKNSPLQHSESAMLLNAIKYLAEIPDNIHLISAEVINQIKKYKLIVFTETDESLNLSETLIALAISSATNKSALKAIKALVQLAGAEMHSTHVLSRGDERPLRKLGIYVTTNGLVPNSRFFME